MNPTDLIPLVQLKYDHQNRIWADLKKREHQIRTALNTLNTPRDIDFTVRQMGHDLIWQRWAQNHRNTLQTQLAQCLAAQNEHRKDIQKTFAQLDAMKRMSDDQNKQETRVKLCKVSDTLDRMNTLRSIDPDALYR